MNKEQVTAIERGSGFGLSGDVGGLPKRLYYTPDGRKIMAVEALRDYVIKNKEGKIISQGRRDANLDKWLDRPPEKPKLYCPSCDKWHDTNEQIELCGKEQNSLVKKMKKKALNDEIEAKDKELQQLSKQVEELTKQVQALLLK